MSSPAEDRDPLEARVLVMEARHVEHGVRQECEVCPVALLAAEHLREGAKVSVGLLFGVTVWWMVGRHRHRAESIIDRDTERFILAFDAGENPAPISVPLTFPRSAWRVAA